MPLHLKCTRPAIETMPDSVGGNNPLTREGHPQFVDPLLRAEAQGEGNLWSSRVACKAGHPLDGELHPRRPTKQLAADNSAAFRLDWPHLAKHTPATSKKPVPMRNSSSRTREVMTIIWYADGTRVGLLDNPNRQGDRDRWLPGLQPGDHAATALDPLLFQR